MATYHLSAQMVKRSEGRNSIAMSAYRSGQKLIDKATGLVKDYTAKTKIFMAEILAPEGSPSWATDRQELWNQVEASEKRKDAQLARELNVALPVELDQAQMYQLVNGYVQSQFVSSGMIADVAYHNLQGDNPHAHIMLTTRRIEGEEFGPKAREWNSKELLQSWRERWEVAANAALEKGGSEARIDHRTLEAQGIDREPQIHVGPSWNAEEPSIRMLRNNAIKERNAEREALKLMLANIDKELREQEKHEQLLERSRKNQLNKSRSNQGLSLSELHRITLVHDQGSKGLSALPVLSQLKRIDRHEDSPVQQDADRRKGEQVKPAEPRVISAPSKAKPAVKEEPKKSLFERIKEKAKALFFEEVPADLSVIEAPTRKPAIKTETEKPAAPQPVEERKVVRPQPKPQSKSEPVKSEKERRAEHDKECRFLADLMHSEETLTYDPRQINKWSTPDREKWEIERGYRKPVDPVPTPDQSRKKDSDQDDDFSPRRR